MATLNGFNEGKLTSQIANTLGSLAGSRISSHFRNSLIGMVDLFPWLIQFQICCGLMEEIVLFPFINRVHSYETIMM